MTDHDEHRDQTARNVVFEARIAMQQARNQYYRERVKHNEVSTETCRELAIRLVQLWDTLYEYRGEQAVEDKWGELDIDNIRTLLDQQATVQQATPGRGTATTAETVPAIATVNPEKLITASKELDEIANALGFAASATNSTPHNEASHDDLHALLKTRGQDEAAKRVPGGPD
jgi:hypothetical protein